MSKRQPFTTKFAELSAQSEALGALWLGVPENRAGYDAEQAAAQRKEALAAARKAGPFHAKLDELEQKNPLLAAAWLSNEANRRGLANERAAEDQLEREEAHDAGAEEIRSLEQRGAVKTAHLRRLEREGRSMEATVFSQTNLYHLNREAQQLADEDPPPTAA